MKKFIFYIILSSVIFADAQTPAPGPKQTKSVLLINGYLHVGNGNVIEIAHVGFRNGIIELVADARLTKIDPSKYDTVINVEGKHIYPAIIAPNSTLGLSEVESVRATLDFHEVGAMNPHIRALIAFNTDSKVNSTVRTNGVLYCQVTPRGGTISGSSSVVSLDAWNWEDAVIKTDEGIHLNFPKTQTTRRGPAKAAPEQNQFEKELNLIRKFFADAKAYHGNAVKEEKNIRFEAMKGILDGTSNLYIHTSYVKDILAAINFCKEFGLKKVVLVGAKDSWKVTKELKENDIAVMLDRVHDLPNLQEQDVDMPYKTAYLLQKDSVTFCLQNAGDMEAMNARNIPFLAGTCAAYGLTKEQALMSITYSPAKIMGVEKQVGSVEEGKQASIFVSSGDALDMKTNNVIMAWVEGRQITLYNTQMQQAEKYMKKYGIK